MNLGTGSPKRVGLALGYDGRMNVKEMTECMREAEARGFEMGFFSETIELMRDSVTALAAFGLATRTMRLGATQVVRLRTPVIMAQTLASLDELAAGRVVLVVGACTETHAMRHGLEPLDPTQTLAEYIEVIRRLVAGDSVTHAGQFVRLDNVRLSWKPIRAAPPIWVAATSPRGLRLAGRVADGVLLNSVASPEYAANAIRILRSAVEKAGRNWEAFEVAQLVNCSVENNRASALEAIRWEVATKFSPSQLPFNARSRLAVGEPHIKPEDLPMFVEAYQAGGKEALAASIPISYLEGLTASGTPEQVLERVDRYRRAGVNLPLLRPAARHQLETLLTLFAPS